MPLNNAGLQSSAFPSVLNYTPAYATSLATKQNSSLLRSRRRFSEAGTTGTVVSSSSDVVIVIRYKCCTSFALSRSNYGASRLSKTFTQKSFSSFSMFLSSRVVVGNDGRRACVLLNASGSRTTSKLKCKSLSRHRHSRQKLSFRSIFRYKAS